MTARRPLYSIHIWLSWIVGLQILIWMATGLFMTAWPIERVRGEHLKREREAVDLRGAAVLPPADILRREERAVETIMLKTWAGQPTYELRYADGGAALVDASSGKRLTPLTRTAAEMVARADYAGGGGIGAVTRVDPKDVPLDFRRDDPAWRVTFTDRADTVLYVSAETGEVLARRTGLSRWFDLMWGLHIMDWRARENINNPLVIVASALALASTLAGAVLLFVRRRWRP
jgi:hypothetical protein